MVIRYNLTYLGKFIFFASLKKSFFEIETMHISKSDQTKLSKTVSCFSSFQMEELRIGLQEDIAKMHTVLAYPKVKVYLVKVIGHPPFFYYSECFMIAAALRDSSGPSRLKYQRKKYSSISTKSKAHGRPVILQENMKRSKKVLMHHLFWSFLMPLWIVFQTFRLASARCT